MENQIQQIREKMFESEVKKKTEQMEAKVEEETEKLTAARDSLTSQPVNDDIKNQLGDNIAKSLFYNNRMNDLGRQERLKIMKGENLTKGLTRIERDFEPTTNTLGAIKESQVYKEVYAAALEKLQKGEVISNDDIKGVQEAYNKREGDKLRRQKLREQNMNKKRDHKNELRNENPHL